MASKQDLFGQLWKEYALSDSRYMTSDTLVLCMETMTVVSCVLRASQLCPIQV
jgi:cholestenol delta-isomerase